MAAHFGQYADQAAREALLHFGPQRSNLADLIRAAQGQYGTKLREGRARATSTKAAINHAIPQIRQIYAGADSASHAGASLLSAALQGASPDSPFRQGQANENAAALNALVAGRTTREANLETQKTGAVAGQQHAQLAAQQILAHELQGLLQKKTGLAGEEGAFAATTAHKLEQEAQKEEAVERRALRGEEGTERRSLRGEAGTERRSRRAEGGGGKGPKQTLDKHAQASSTISAIERLGGVLLGAGHSRAETIDQLERGKPAKEQGKPSIPAYKPDILMSAALDEAQYGFVQKSHWNRLRKLGYDPGKLGLHPPQTHTAAGVTGGVNASGR